MQQQDSQHLTLVKGGKITPAEFIKSSLSDKLRLLATRPVKEQLDLILSDPAGKSLVQAIPTFRFYLLIKEIGEEDALELVHLASPSQLAFMLDLELWKKWQFQQQKGMLWLERLMSGGESFISGFIGEVDEDLLVLLLMREIEVGGGTGVLLTDDERLESWDHSFDQVYFISFRKGGNSRLTGTFLDILHRNRHSLYLTLMERIKVETVSELEDSCFQNRSGRLCDSGFPEYDDAISTYAFVNPSAFRTKEEKHLEQIAGVETLPLPPEAEGSLLGSIMQGEGGEQLAIEFNYLMNNLFVVDQPDFSDHGAVQAVMERASGYVTIALQYLCGADEQKSVKVAREEYLKDLFRLGFSLVLEQARRGSRLKSTDYATGKVLEGLKSSRPRFYRGLDPDHIDAYREFRTYADVQKTAQLLSSLEG